jgi:DNA helicase HerA-like ATPase
MSQKIIGKIAALEKCPTTIDDFYFWTDKNTILSPFDVVVVDHISGSKTFGVVQEISHITDSESYLGSYISSDFGQFNAPETTERIGLNYVHAHVVGNTKNIYIPVQNNKNVFLGSEEDVKAALGLERTKDSIVCGYLEMYSNLADDKIELPVYINPDFLIGPEGAHLNISGISGLATKTSYAMFLLNALQQQSLGSDNGRKSVAYIFMNVKGRDLLTIDKYNDTLSEEDLNMYTKMHLNPTPFERVKYFYPYGERGSVKSYVRPATLKEQEDKGCAFKYKYTYNEDIENLDLLFANIDDPNQTIDSIINYIISRQPPFDSSETWQGMLDAVQEMGVKGSERGSKEISVLSWRKFKRIVRKSIESEKIFNDVVNIDKNEVRLEDAIKGIKPNDVFVVDVAKQDENMQAFVFGSVIQSIIKLKLGEFDDTLTQEGRDSIPDRVIVFVDELNKYASNDAPKNSPILRLLLDIAERGRSLGIILFSAEQFKSAIHKRVTGNCSTHAYGRTNSIEVSDKTYSFVPSTYKNIMTRLKQGHYVIQNPILHSLLKIRFPMPLYKQDKGDG